MSGKSRGQRTENRGQSAAGAEVSAITLDTTDCQLSPEDLAERAEACGEVCDTAKKIYIESLGLSRHVERRFHLLNRAKLEAYLKEIERLGRLLKPKLERLPYVGAIVLCMMLAGCADARGLRCTACGDAAAGPGGATSAASYPTCSGPNCKAK